MSAKKVSGYVLRGATIMIMVVAFAGCAKSAPTHRVTLPTTSPTDTPAATDTPMPTDTPVALPSPSTIATPTTAPTDTPTDTPAASGSGGPAAACTGTAEHQAFFAEAASVLSLDVYCAALPTGWWLQATEYKEANGGYLTIQYKNLGGGQIDIGEGNFCAGLPDCWASASDLGTASFGDRSGQLKLLAGGQYAVFVDSGTTHGYRMIGKGMSQADFVAMAAAMVKVAKS